MDDGSFLQDRRAMRHKGAENAHKNGFFYKPLLLPRL